MTNANIFYTNQSKEQKVNQLNKEQIRQIRLLIRITDIRYSNGYSIIRPSVYSVYLVDIYSLKNNRQPNPIYRIIKLIKSIISTVNRPKMLKERRFYNFNSILKSAYIIPADYYKKAKLSDTFFINNYID